jgi:hypothetical protein
VIFSLLDDVVDAERVDAGDPGLHLQLRVVDARLVIKEASCCRPNSAGVGQKRLACARRCCREQACTAREAVPRCLP